MAREKRAVPKVRVIAKHRKGCDYKGNDNAIVCECPKIFRWFQDGKLHRPPAPADWQKAVAQAKQMEAKFAAGMVNGNGTHNVDKEPGTVTPEQPVAAPPPAALAVVAFPAHANGNGKTLLKDAVKLFLKTKKGAISLKHYEAKLRPLLEDKLLAYAAQNNLVCLSDIKPPHILAFRDELKQNNGRDYAVGSKKKLFHYLAEFFDFAVDTYDDLAKTPVTKAAKIKVSKEKKKPKALTEAQFEQFHAAIPKLKQNDRVTQMLPALLLLMFRTGLSLRDAVLLPRAAMRPNGSSKYWMVRTARAKTGSDVFCTIRAEVAEMILAGANPEGDYLFVDSVPEGERALDSFIKKWGDRIKKLGKVANIQTAKGERLYPTSHWMRHSFVRWCLDYNISTENIAYMIGDTLAVVAEHYSEWIEGAQDTLTETMKRAYEQEEKTAQAATAGR